MLKKRGRPVFTADFAVAGCRHKTFSTGCVDCDRIYVAALSTNRMREIVARGNASVEMQSAGRLMPTGASLCLISVISVHYPNGASRADRL